MAIKKRCLSVSKSLRKIALANLVESQESGEGYRYIATRIYDTEADTVVDVALAANGCVECLSSDELCYALWQELPMLDTRTKRLVGKNKDKYCTLIAARVFKVPSKAAERWDVKACRVEFPPETQYQKRNNKGIAVSVYILGYTFMDINGDKAYMPVAQLRKSDVFRHTHSTARYVVGEVCGRRVTAFQGTLPVVYTPTLEVEDTDASLKDEEVAQIKSLKTLLGTWYTMLVDGTIQVDQEELRKRQLEELEIPDGITHIPNYAFTSLDTLKRIKLPETIQTIGYRSFNYLKELVEINIPSQVKELNYVFMRCGKFKQLDASGVESFTDFEFLTAERLIVPDMPQEIVRVGNITADILEFRNTTNARQRELKALSKKSSFSSIGLKVGRIETNGPVVLGNYGVDINCTDASALEPNIIGIAPDCSFHKVDAKGNILPWVLGPAAEFVCASYRFTEEAYKANKLRAAVVDVIFDVSLPKSVEILQGVLSESMCKEEYPNVVYASLGLCFTCGLLFKLPKLPLLRWLLPKGEILTERQIKDLESKLTPKLPEICKRTQEALGLDLTDANIFKTVRQELLCGREEYRKALAPLFKKYGMIYIGDYSEVLRGNQ